MRQYRAAIADDDKAIRLNQSFTSAYYNRGNLKVLLGDKDGARTDFETVLNLARNIDDANLEASAQESLKDLIGNAN